MMELDEAVNKLAEAMSRVEEAISDILLFMGEGISSLLKHGFEDVDLSYLAELAEWWKLEGRRQEEDRQKALELKLVPKRVVKLSKSKRIKVRKKNLNRIRKELRLYEKLQ